MHDQHVVLPLPPHEVHSRNPLFFPEPHVHARFVHKLRVSALHGLDFHSDRVAALHVRAAVNPAERPRAKLLLKPEAPAALVEELGRRRSRGGGGVRFLRLLLHEVYLKQNLKRRKNHPTTA